MTLDKIQPVKKCDHDQSTAQKCFEDAYAGFTALVHDVQKYGPGMLKGAASAVEKNPRLAAEAGLTAVCVSTAVVAESPLLIGGAILGTTVFGGALVWDATNPCLKDLENKLKNIKM